MEEAAFGDKAHRPTDGDLAALLGRAKRYWDKLVGAALEADSTAQAEWKYYSSKSGWSHVVRNKRRALLYLSPAEKGFTASFAIGERALDVARQSGVPAEIVKLIEEAPKYPEGRGVRVEVKSAAEAEVAAALLALKVAN